MWKHLGQAGSAVGRTALHDEHIFEEAEAE